MAKNSFNRCFPTPNNHWLLHFELESTILNKIGLFNLPARAAGYERDECGRMMQVCLSARIGEELEFIKLALAEAVEQRASQQYRIQLQVGNVASRCTPVSY